MNLITFIFGVIILIFAILQIVLFFKLWRMTNDVHLIKENKQISSNDKRKFFGYFENIFCWVIPTKPKKS